MDWQAVWTCDVKLGDLVKVPWNPAGELVTGIELQGRRVRIEFNPMISMFFDWNEDCYIIRGIVVEPEEQSVREAFEIAVKAADPHAVNWLKRHPQHPDHYMFTCIEQQFQAFKERFDHACHQAQGCHTQNILV